MRLEQSKSWLVILLERQEAISRLRQEGQEIDSGQLEQVIFDITDDLIDAHYWRRHRKEAECLLKKK